MTIFLLIIAFVVLFLVFFWRSKEEKKPKGNWLQFFAKGKEAGFSIRELEQIRRLVVNCNIPDPASIFTSQKELEICIRSVVSAVRMAGNTDNPAMQDFLARLFDFCKEMGMKNSEKKSIITSTHQITEGQILRVLMPGTGVLSPRSLKTPVIQ